MTTANTRARGIGIVTAEALVGAASRARADFDERLRRRAAYARTLGELKSLSDRELADIGIRRCDIARIARDEARRG